MWYAFTQPTASSAYLVSLLSSTVSSGLSRVNHDLASSYSTTLVYSIEDLWKSLVSFCFLPSYASCLLYLSIFCLLYYRAYTVILEVVYSCGSRLMLAICRDFCVTLHFLLLSKQRKMHSVWKSQKKSHSILRAKRATYTFWVDKIELEMPKIINLDEILKISNETFWVIFKHCAKERLLCKSFTVIESPQKRRKYRKSFISVLLCSWENSSFDTKIDLFCNF